jgi:hypothetical protein
MGLRSHRLTCFLVASAVAASALSGCRGPADRKRVLTKDQQATIADNVLKERPTPKHAVDATFSKKIKLLGYDLAGTPLKAGGKAKLTLYFETLAAVKGDWKIFVHFEAPGKRRQPFDHYGVGDLYPVGEWKQGEIVRDEIDFDVPGDWPAGPVQIMVGFFDWAAFSAGTDRRLIPEAKAPAKTLPDNRVIIAELDVGGGKAASTPPRQRTPKPGPLTVVKATAAPKIDGAFDDEAWKRAQSTPVFRRPDGQRLNPRYRTQARMVWDDAFLYVGWETRDDDVVNKNAAKDSTLWEGDVVELFIKPDSGKPTYYEFQFGPHNSKFDARFTSHRKPEWKAAAKYDADSRHAAQVDGTLNEPSGGEDKGWRVEAAIPWSAFGLEKAPGVGARWTANLYRIDHKGTHNMAFMGTWIPVGGDFHKLDGAGTLVFSGVPGDPVPREKDGTPKIGPAPAAKDKAAQPAAGADEADKADKADEAAAPSE